MTAQVQAPSFSSASQPDAIRVLCVDDNRDLTQALRMLFDIEAGIEWVGCLYSADHVVEEARRLQAGVVVMDACMVGKDPFEALKELGVELPQARVIVYSASDDEALWERARNAGAHGCVCKFEDPDTIIHAVREVAAGHTFFRSPR